MTRAQLEAFIADYLDGVLSETDAAEFEKYLPLYPDLAELVHDAADAIRVLNQVETPEPPPALYAQIHLSLEAERKKAERKRSSTGLWDGLLGFFAPVLQPRFVMGMAMTVLSISMVGQLTGTRIDQVTAADLKPAAIWSSVEYRAQRVWDRATKYYESLRVVYEMRTRVQEWRTQLDQERERAASRLDDPETEVGRSPQGADAPTATGASGEREKAKDK
jgi:anti-sigma factor RsiW